MNYELEMLQPSDKNHVNLFKRATGNQEVTIMHGMTINISDDRVGGEKVH